MIDFSQLSKFSSTEIIYKIVNLKIRKGFSSLGIAGMEQEILFRKI